MSVFSESLQKKFAALLERYPERRCALVPMLLYAQEELGHLTPEALREIAALHGESEMTLREVIGYYSMLRTRPAGKFHVQVCTNISCLLRGSDEIWQHCRQKLGIDHHETTTDGVFSLEEVECIGACSWAPALQVNYDFHQELTPAKVDEILESYRARAGSGGKK